MTRPIYKLRDWVPLNRIDWDALLENEYAIEFIEKYTDLLQNPNKLSIRQWNYLLGNRHHRAIAIIEKHIHNIKNKYLLRELSTNPVAIPILEKHMDKINWNGLSKNAHAVHLLEQNPDRIDWSEICNNPNPKVIPIIEQNLDRINWSMLSGNRNAINLLKQNPDKIDWHNLSYNISKQAVEMLLENPDKIDWCMLCNNSNYKAMELIEQNIDKISTEEGWANLSLNQYAIHILQKNLDKVCWTQLSRNEGIFTLDLVAMREQNRELKEAIIQAAMHPRRVQKWLDTGVELEDM